MQVIIQMHRLFFDFLGGICGPQELKQQNLHDEQVDKNSFLHHGDGFSQNKNTNTICVLQGDSSYCGRAHMVDSTVHLHHPIQPLFCSF